MPDAMTKVSKEAQNIAARLTEDITNVAGQRVAFSLFIWTDGRCTYISDADRGEIINVLETMIVKWKQGMPDIPHSPGLSPDQVLRAFAYDATLKGWPVSRAFPSGGSINAGA